MSESERLLRAARWCWQRYEAHLLRFWRDLADSFYCRYYRLEAGAQVEKT